VAIDPRGNASDVDDDPLSVVIVSGPVHGSLVRNADGSFTYTPTAYYAGGDSFTYKVNDGAADSNVATIVLTVTQVNHVPVAVNDTAATDQGVPVTINVLANDSDIDNVLSVASFQLGGSNVVAGGLNSTYSLYFDFNATGHLTSANTDPLAGMTSGVFDTLTYSLVGANGNSTFSTAGNNPAVTNAGSTQVLATGSLQNGVNVSIPLGGTFVPSAAASVSFAVAAGKEGFFSPAPFYNVASTAFVNAITSLSRFGAAGAPGSGFTVNNGGGNLNFAAPVPEPQTYALMLAGLGMVGWAASRRRARARI